MKEQHKCGECGRPFFVTMIKVFVFKHKLCPADKEILKISTDGEVYTCPKCKKVVLKKDNANFVNLGISISGSTRNIVDADEKRNDGHTEVEKVMVPEQQLCQRCRNYQNRYMQATAKRERKLKSGVPDGIRVIPDDIKDKDIYRYEIMKKTQEDYKAKQMAEMRAQQEKAAKEYEAEQKIKLIKKVSEKLIEPSQMKPLIDPETQKLIDEQKKKDEENARKQK